MNTSNKAVQTIISRLIALILICVGAIVAIWWILPAVITTPREKMQDNLAKELGVNIQDYPKTGMFPSSYFKTVLRAGMSISDVHKIVKGYEEVMRCDNNSEIYYYFSIELEDTERFELIYDDHHRYKSFREEDPDSRTIWTDGCVPGLIEE